MAEDKTIVNRSTSPVVEAEVVAENKPMDFSSAIAEVVKGNKITKLEWGNKDIYGHLNTTNYHLTLHKEDGVDYDWIISEGDLIGKDWVLV